MKSYKWILIVCSVLGVFCPVFASDAAEKTLPSLDQRFGSADVQESPSFQRHVVPLLSRLGCNGEPAMVLSKAEVGFDSPSLVMTSRQIMPP